MKLARQHIDAVYHQQVLGAVLRTAAIAVFLSRVVARMLMPVMAAFLLRDGSRHAREVQRLADAPRAERLIPLE